MSVHLGLKTQYPNTNGQPSELRAEVNRHSINEKDSNAQQNHDINSNLERFFCCLYQNTHNIDNHYHNKNLFMALCLLIGLVLFVSVFQQAHAHSDNSYHHDISDLPSQKCWMKMLADDILIRNISIPGTHDSTSRYGGDAAQTQSLSITQQLNGGIRFLDVRLRHTSDKFSLYHGFISQNLNFEDVLSEVRIFLMNNPSETVFMRLRKEYKDGTNSRSWEETYKDYENKFSDVLWTSSYYNPKLGSVRGRIIVLDDMDGMVNPRSGLYFRYFVRQDDFNLNSNWDLYGKWIKVKKYLQRANDRKNNVINFLSASGGSFPYFVASGHSSPSTTAPRLLTGKTTPGWKNSDPDFPRVSCFIGICSIAFEGINTTN